MFGGRTDQKLAQLFGYQPSTEEGFYFRHEQADDPTAASAEK